MFQDNKIISGAFICNKSQINVLIMADMYGWNNALTPKDETILENVFSSIKRVNIMGISPGGLACRLPSW
ncbi:hypothetical protein NS31R_12925 [Enterobacter cancerogenus]|nr:hypothetical protein NS104_14265 [Enterobacter cancerogenus]KTQ49137.1 hypothetical protein NS111_18575 [Enterobacter cancerogenus]KTQ69265.1 hypothetical protein NS188_20400 [Enterobacter cancerogenus]KTQ80354.1 hypothetical protein NS31R_12925 [Enterobacter cancerogenus]